MVIQCDLNWHCNLSSSDFKIQMVPKNIILTTLPSRELLNPPQEEAQTPIPNYVSKRPQKVSLEVTENDEMMC